MILAYKITVTHEESFVYIPKFKRKFTLHELGKKMRELRDPDPDLYAALVPIYVKLDAVTPRKPNVPKPRNGYSNPDAEL